MNRKRTLTLLVAGLFGLCVLSLIQPPTAPAVPPGGAQYGVDIPGGGGPDGPGGEPVAEPGNLSPSAQNALNEFDSGNRSTSSAMTADERRQLILAGTSPQLGAPAGGEAASPGSLVPGAATLGPKALSDFNREEPGFLEAATGSTDGFPLFLMAALLALTAAVGAVAYRARRATPRGPQAK